MVTKTGSKNTFSKIKLIIVAVVVLSVVGLVAVSMQTAQQVEVRKVLEL